MYVVYHKGNFRFLYKFDMRESCRKLIFLVTPPGDALMYKTTTLPKIVINIQALWKMKIQHLSFKIHQKILKYIENCLRDPKMKIYF